MVRKMRILPTVFCGRVVKKILLVVCILNQEIIVFVVVERGRCDKFRGFFCILVVTLPVTMETVRDKRMLSRRRMQPCT